MRWLLWKEIRQNWIILTFGVGVLVWFSVLFGLVDGAFVALILSPVIFALLGGNAIAGEHADRSAEFLAYQPIPRFWLWQSKLILPLLLAICLWGSVVVWYIHTVADRDWVVDLDWFPVLVAAGCCAYGVAWMVSALQNSVTFAVGAGVGVTFVLFVASNVQTIKQFHTVLATMYVLTALTCFAAGSWYYLTRVNP